MQILKVIGLLMEYPDELLWECKEDALALIRRDAPMLTDFTHNLLNAPLLDKQAEWCEVFDQRAHHVAAAVRTCSCRVPRSRPGNGGPAGGV